MMSKIPEHVFSSNLYVIHAFSEHVKTVSVTGR